MSASADRVTNDEQGVDRYIDHVLGLGDHVPNDFSMVRPRSLFEPFGDDCRGLGRDRWSELHQLLAARPHKLRFLTPAELRVAGDEGVRTLRDATELHRARKHGSTAVTQRLYGRVAGGLGGEYGFRRGRDLATAVGYDTDLLEHIPGAVVSTFVGLGNPWLLSRPRAGERCIDLGCGTGLDAFFASLSVGSTGHVVGLDVTHAMVALARDNVGRTNGAPVTLLQASADAVPMPDGSADAVTANGVMVLLEDVPKVLGECHRLLRPGGTLRLADTVFGDVDDVTGISDTGVPDLQRWHRLAIGRPFAGEWRALLESRGFVDVEISGPVDPFLPDFDQDNVNGCTIQATRR